MTCSECGRERADGERGWRLGRCSACYQRQWSKRNPHHNRRAGKRAEQKRAWDQKAAARRRESMSDRADKTPGNQSDPATAGTVRGHGNQEGPS